MRVYNSRMGTATLERSPQTYRALRLIGLRDLFDSGCRGSTAELAVRFGVSPRTMQRDLDDIEVELRYPLIEEHGQWRRAFAGERIATALERETQRLEAERIKLERRWAALKNRLERVGKDFTGG